MTNPCIIYVAITGSLPTKNNNPAVPITIAEQIESHCPDLVDWLASELRAHEVKPEVKAFDLGHTVQALRIMSGWIATRLPRPTLNLSNARLTYVQNTNAPSPHGSKPAICSDYET